jgi:uncharacterized membrane protein YphA (DoxX/SURF4 family)
MSSNDTHAIRLDRPPADAATEPPDQIAGNMPWGAAHKVAFRFAFAYFALYIVCIGPCFFFPSSLALLETPWKNVVPWVAAHVLHIDRTVPVVPGLTDSTYGYVKMFCFLLVALLAAVMWSLIDRRRTEYVLLNKWIHLSVRLLLAYTMLSYGAFKVIPAQMPAPGLSALVQPFGDTPPHVLFVNFIGSSTGYEISAGIGELVSGVLLLIPSTILLGALMAVGILANVAMLNLFYDFPARILVACVMLMALFVLVPDVRRLVNFFVLHRPEEPKRAQPAIREPRLHYLGMGIQWGLGVWTLVATLSLAGTMHRQTTSAPLNNPLYGIWKVDEFVTDGEVHPPLLTDKLRWQRLVIDSGPEQVIVMVQDMNADFFPYVATIDASKSSLSIKNASNANLKSMEGLLLSPWRRENATAQVINADVSYSRSQPGTVILDGKLNEHQLHVTLRKEERQFVLRSHKFHWMTEHEHDYFREYLSTERSEDFRLSPPELSQVRVEKLQ